jgi:hypothetical protein
MRVSNVIKATAFKPKKKKSSVYISLSFEATGA